LVSCAMQEEAFEREVIKNVLMIYYVTIK